MSIPLFSGKYDALNRIRKLFYPRDLDDSRKELVPVYNKAGALHSLKLGATTYVEEIAYNARGQRILMAMNNGMMTRYAYDPETFRLARTRAEKYSVSGLTYTSTGGVQQDLAYAYDLEGTITAMNDRAPNNNAAQGPGNLYRQFSHDPLRRLLSATGRESSNVYTQPSWDLNIRPQDRTATNAYTRSFAYDKIGNIQTLNHVAAGHANQNFVRIYNYASASNNHLNSFTVSSNSFTNIYDANGNLTKEGTTRYLVWGHNDKPVVFYNRVNLNTPNVFTHYFYNAQGDRVKKITRKDQKLEVTVYVDGGLFEESYFKPNGVDIDNKYHFNTLYLKDGNSSLVSHRIGNNDDDPSPAIQYNIEDHLGNSSVRLTTTGALINREEYYPFGETSFGGFRYKRYRFNGKEKDEDSGLYNYGQRYYAPWLCRFVSVDPIAEDYPQYTSYNYAGNKPVSKRDLEGLQEEGAEKGGGSGAKNGENSVTDPSNGYLLPEVEVTDIGPNAPDPKQGLIPSLGQPPTNLSPKETPKELIPGNESAVEQEVSKNQVNKFFKALKWLFVANPITTTAAAVLLSPAEAGRGSDADTYLGRTLDERDPADAWMDHPDMFKLDEVTGDRKNDPNIKWVTYTKYNPISDQTYSGRASGPASMTKIQIVQGRDKMHTTLDDLGYLPANPDEEGVGIEGYAEIRGREQQLIDNFGGARTDKKTYPPDGGISGNEIRGVARENKFGLLFYFYSTRKFGRLARFTGDLPF